MSLHDDEGDPPPPAREEEDAPLPVSSTQVIPPPPLPRKNTSGLRLRDSSAKPRGRAWAQPEMVQIPRMAAPPADLAELHPQLRDTVRPGRLTA